MKKKIPFMAKARCLSIAVLILVQIFMPLQAFSLAGDANDPLVSKAWVDQYVENTVRALEQKAEALLVQSKQMLQKKIVLSPSSKTAYINEVAHALDTAPLIISVVGGGVTLVPLRFLGEALGIMVSWDDKSDTVICANSKIRVVLPLKGSEATINGKKIALQVSPRIENNRTLVPLRFISQAFGCTVDWNGAKQQITVMN